MTREEIEKEWQKELKKFVDYHSDKMKNMTEEESNKYVKENKVNEKLQQLQQYFKKKYNTQKQSVLFQFYDILNGIKTNNLEEYYNKYGDKVTTILDYMNSNESATTILSNYDVVKQNDMYIILNRGIILVKEGEKAK